VGKCVFSEAEAQKGGQQRRRNIKYLELPDRPLREEKGNKIAKGNQKIIAQLVEIQEQVIDNSIFNKG
jgi:hypothetical protein